MSFLGASLSPEEVVIVTELMAGGTLWRALKTGKVTFYRRRGSRGGLWLIGCHAGLRWMPAASRRDARL